MVIVDPIQRVEIQCSLSLDKLLVDFDCLHIGFDDAFIVPEQDINVTGHVHQVTCTWHRAAQPIRGGQSLLRMR